MYHPSYKMYLNPFLLTENTIWGLAYICPPKCVKIVEIEFNEMCPKCTANFMKCTSPVASNS